MARRTRYIRLPKRQRRLVAILLGGYLVLLVNSLLLYLFERSTALVYMSNVLLHIVLGLLFVLPSAVFVALHVAKMPIRRNWKAAGAGLLTAASLLLLLSTGIGLVVLGSSAEGGIILHLHIAAVFSTVGAFGLHVSMKRGVRYQFLEWKTGLKGGWQRALRHPLSVTVLAGCGVMILVVATSLANRGGRVFSSGVEGDPLSSAQAVLAHADFLEDDALGGSETCGQAGCHPDVVAQWEVSAHRFSSFNNPYYRKSIEAMVERSGNDAARWCASCHDPLVLFTGRFADSVALDMDHPTAQAGLTCFSCHAITSLRDVKGNGRYVVSAPDLYPFASAEGGAGKYIHDGLIRAKPEPHRTAMLKSMHRTSEFCGTCHKVGLPPNVNNYRWKRGQNEYDAWQSSGTSGNTVRSFYLPSEPKNCVDCHMPLVSSRDQGSENGLIRSHAFAAANTALPFLNGHGGQLRATQEALRGAATVDIFRVFAEGRTYGPDEPLPPLGPGDEVDVTVVVRNRGVGHLLPGGTNDSNEMWLELVALGDGGEPVLASGLLDAAGRVDSTAHFWGTVQVDRASREINRRNAQDWIATVYMNAISPGTAHTVHYRFEVPPGRVISEFRAALKHRKFKWYFHNWTFRGRVADGEPDSLARLEVDLRTWELADGEAPDLPVSTLAEAARDDVDGAHAAAPLWERWNDYGIGLLLEEDTRGALDAFARVSELEPGNPEGPLNQARVYLEEGLLERAEGALQEAERRRPGYLKTAYFRGEWLRAHGLYEEALEQWMRVYDTYPADRVLLLGIARVHYLSGDYEATLDWVERVLEIDPEDLGALYNRMLALAALGRSEEHLAAQALYQYHKDDEEAMAVTGPFKQRHPMANREAQPIHFHELARVRSVELPYSGSQTDGGGESVSEAGPVPAAHRTARGGAGQPPRE